MKINTLGSSELTNRDTASMISSKNQFITSILNRLIPDHHQHVGQALIYLPAHCLLEYMAWLHNHRILKRSNCIEARSIFMEKCMPALTSSVISLIAYLEVKNEMAYY